LAFASKIMGLECKVYMVRISFDQKPFRKMMMRVWGAECLASPSDKTESGKKFLEQYPDTPGSLGMAISEAVEEAVKDSSGKTKYSLGSVLNHVMLHQTIIGLEAKKQLEIAGEKKPDIVIACAGGGSNFAGLSFPFIYDKINGEDIDVIAVEPKACPTLTKGPFAYDFGDVSCLTPLLAMYTLGHAFVPPPIHAGGLRYHGMAPLVSKAVADGLVRAKSYHQLKCYEAALTWAQTEGFICAPETSHAIACTIDEALKAKKEGKEKVIIFNYSGHGLMDLTGYEKYLDGQLHDYELPDAELQKSIDQIKEYPQINK